MATIPDPWLPLTTEDAIDPELMICDSHHHLWYQTPDSYSLEDFVKDASGGHQIAQTVFVESRKMLKPDASAAMQPVGETEYVRELLDSHAKQTPTYGGIAAGIVGFADFTLGTAVLPVLEAHLTAGRGRFKGVRYSTTWDASPAIHSSAPQGLMANARFREGFACLKRYDLSFDAWLYHTQLLELVDLARAFPDVPIILNHIGGPLGIGPYAQRRAEIFKSWKKGIKALASCGNVSVKLGGLGMELFGFDWRNRPKPLTSVELAEQFSPFFLWCLECFGVERCMFESNFPVDKKAYSYTVLWNAFKRVTQGFSMQEKQCMFYNTPVKLYRIRDK